MELPIFILSTQSLFQMSSLVDLTLVMEGPSARWAPEQFMQTKTPKSRDAPGLGIKNTAGRFAVAVGAELVLGAFQEGSDDFLLGLVSQHRDLKYIGFNVCFLDHDWLFFLRSWLIINLLRLRGNMNFYEWSGGVIVLIFGRMTIFRDQLFF